MSIFGDETITIIDSPESGQEEVMAEETENEEVLDDQDYEGNNDSDDGDEQEDDDTDDVQSEEDEQDSPPDNGHGDGPILGKFKTNEDLAAAYQSLQREFTKSRQGGADLQQPGGNTTAIVPQQGQEQEPDYNTLFWEKFRDNPLGTMQSLIGHVVQNQTAPILEERRNTTLSANIQTVAKEYRQVGTEEGLKTLIGKVGEIAQEFGNPELVRNPSPRILQMAAREAFGDTKAQAFQKGKEAGRGESEKARQSKQGNGAKGGARQQPAPAMSEDDSTKAGILAAGRGGGIFG